MTICVNQLDNDDLCKEKGGYSHQKDFISLMFCI